MVNSTNYFKNKAGLTVNITLLGEDKMRNDANCGFGNVQIK